MDVDLLPQRACKSEPTSEPLTYRVLDTLARLDGFRGCQSSWVAIIGCTRIGHEKKYNGHPIDEEIVRSLLTFSFFFTITIAAIALGLALIGLDWITALSGAATAVCNVGPGLGTIIGPAGNFSALPDAAKWLLTVGMLLGRLEILTVLVLVTPVFWRY